MNLLRGLGKAGTDTLGGVIKGAGKLVETVGDVAEKAPIVGGVGTVVEATGQAIENIGEKTEDFGEEVFDRNENNPKQGFDPLNDDDDDNDNDIDEAEKKLMNDENRAVGDDTGDSDDDDEAIAKAIPKNFSLKSTRNNKYLRYISESDDTDGLLRFSGNNIVGPYSKFAIRASQTEPGLVHIRCCYNNKFWVRLSEDSNYIAAIANEEQEDKSKWSCTLFEPIFLPDKKQHYIRHVQLNTFLCLAESHPSPYNDCLAATIQDISTIDENLVLLTAMDWDSIFILPKYVAFKGNNGEYLEPSGKYLKFSASNVEDSSVVFEIISQQDGYVHIKHVNSGKYWVRDPNWIWCESTNPGQDNPNALFWPVKVDSNIVALRNKGNNHFCKRLTTEGKTNCLNAAVVTITDTARLEVVEIVVARSIEDVEYRVNDARVYGKKILTVSKGVAINNTEVADKVVMKFRYEKKVETSWSSSVSSTFGISTKVSAKIPTVGKLKFELSMEVSKGSSEATTEEEKSFVETAETITIPPMSKVKFSAVVTQARCDVPFSYTQKDTLKDGRQVSHRLEDGIFRGVTTYDYKFETEKFPL
ncbi:uncharacterized protein LOC111784387 [Cucurbita pepo subsp. pepo]|uniref:uncharacterized protein LOC111784387 n=1 Tax=Cucurbita pepo subsp. pepo TaxID=3664 RepID=UPI000C9D2A3D|nr:uncharacterized protein LOC111784387 [Cucurbita pepo subsp. pepo]